VTTLLAKSRRGGRELQLDRHLVDTDQAAAALFRVGSRWGESFVRFFKIPSDRHSIFLLHVRIAALFHDLGKANEGFQSAMRATQYQSQPLRHEHLSALMLAYPPTAQWLAGCAALDQDVVLAGVLGHHLKAGDDTDSDYKVLACRSNAATRLFFADPQVGTILGRIATLLGLAPLTVRWPLTYQESDSDWANAYESLWDRAESFQRAIGRDPHRLALNLAVKAGVIAADSVASAMFREDLSVEGWIDEVAHGAPLAQDAVDRDILRPRISEIEGKHAGRVFAYQRFQDGAATVGPRGLLLAGCGAGKTLAAWRWADAVSRSRPIGRVVFLYPTRGTATEGFRDYVGHAPEGTASLVHGTARYELSGMAENPAERPLSLDGKRFMPDEAEDRLYALGLWSKRYFSATVDQFLSFVEHGYAGLCLLPALADAAVVLDEVHSYDKSMWNALTAFLRHFDVPVLCMTATLPSERRNELEGLGLRVYPEERDRDGLRDLAIAEEHPRYLIEPIGGEEVAFERARNAIAAGLRVLWVVNTVARCQRIASRVREFVREPFVYHSRFTLEDRKARHRATVDAFAPSGDTGVAGTVAVTTQVCEMSLDLDADVLITEHAPISSLVQRFGRAHRHMRLGRAPAAVLTYPPEGGRPYDQRELAPVAAFLAELRGRACSQRDLAAGLLAHSPLAPTSPQSTRFTRGGFFATPGNLRDDDASGAVVILSDHVDEYVAKRKRGEATDGLHLNVPRKFARPDPSGRLPAWLRIADSDRYDSWLGFQVGDDLRTA
jgi:CRISPR-associated endonuclease/helicase Cas3